MSAPENHLSKLPARFPHDLAGILQRHCFRVTMRPVKPKLHEIAKRAGVSEATVSRVLNQRPGVAQRTRRQVLDALSELGYSFAIDHARQTGVVGIITPELDNPIFPVMAQAIESRLARLGILTVIGPATPTTAHERDYLQHFIRIGATGVVVINGGYANRDIGYGPYQSLLDDGIAVVLVNGIYEPCPIPAVSVDIAGAAQTAIRHLISLGHRRIGCIAGEMRYTPPQDLVAGYRRALDEADIPFDNDLVIETLFTVEGAKSATTRLIDRNVTGLLAISDLMALGAIKAAEAQGVRVPDDLSVIGFDGTPLLGMLTPALTTLRQPVNRMARSVAAMLSSQMNGDRQPTQLFQADLIAGATAGVAPALSR